MESFKIIIRSFQDVQDFVDLATVQPFRVMVGSDSQQINGKSFMGMFGLDYRGPVMVSVDCSKEELQRFLEDIKVFLA